MGSETRAQFDISDSFDAAAEHVKQQVTGALIQALYSPNLSDLRPSQQLETILIGTVTALLGVLFINARDDAREEIMAAVAEQLPHCREIAESIIKEPRHD